MESHTLPVDMAEEILRDNGYAEEADIFLREISANPEKAQEIMDLLKKRALEVLANERTQEQIDASWSRLVSRGDMSTEIQRVKDL